MLETNFLPLNKEQLNLLLKPGPFALLREAKRIISTEFSKELPLHSKDVVNHIHAFSKESKDERLLDIYNELQQYIEIEPQAVPSIDKKASDKKASSITSTPTKPKSAKIKVGDIIDGKRCSGFYRGQPVFDED